MSLQRCEWAGGDPLYLQYHDEEWGVPVHDDQRHFEMICLEGAQAGLSWITILRKRDNYRAAFANFDPVAVADFEEEEVEKLLANPGIVRNRLKVRGFIRNAHAFLRTQGEFGTFDDYIWRFVGGAPIVNHWQSLSEIPANARSPGDEQGSRQARLYLRRPNHLLCIHAGSAAWSTTT